MAVEVIYGVRLVRVAPLDPDGGVPTTPQWQVIEGVQQVQVQPVYVEGQQVEVRGDDRLIAVVRDDDEYIGADLTIQNVELDLSILPALVGGTYTPGPPRKWEPRPVGQPAPGFIMEVYAARFGEGSQHSSDEVGYDKYVFPNCKATGPQFTLQDRNFATPQFTIRARDNKTDNLRFMSIEEVTALPA